jgi:myo-inositol-1-phosphate synthase
MPALNLAIAGVGNCASALLQGLVYYRDHHDPLTAGICHETIGDYRLTDIIPVAAFDIDARKVNRPLHAAAFAPPNCTTRFQPKLPDFKVTVQMGPPLDGVAAHMADYPAEHAFRPADAAPIDLAQHLRDTHADVLVCYLPVGAEDAVKAYAQAALDAGVAFVN